MYDLVVERLVHVSSVWLRAMLAVSELLFFFFFNATATTEIYTLSLHDALPIWRRSACSRRDSTETTWSAFSSSSRSDRKSTRLNSSHLGISYAVFCLKKKNHPSIIRILASAYSYMDAALSAVN